MKMSEQLGITVKKNEDFSEWYTQVVLKAELADYSHVRGCMVIKPLGYAIWENIQKVLDKWFKETGVKNVYFPIFIPEDLLKKEAEHFKGFSPEVAWVTQGGNEVLSEKLALRPTSETVMYHTFAKWIRSHRDLPLRINQWCNVIRWETKAAKLFLRTKEFLWQEGHTVHTTEEEANEEMLLRLNQYKKFCEDYLAIAVLTGYKSEREKFAGAHITSTIEALMPDGKALQMGTSHNLGQHFAKVFDISYLDEKKKQMRPWQASWGVSTRMIGALVMMHGDDKGLVLPPRIASLHVVIVPIGTEKDEKVLKKAKEVKQKLVRSGYSVELDDRKEYTPGWKFNDWELKGVPVRIEVGPRDVKKKKLVLVRRDNLKKKEIREKDVVKEMKKLMDDIQTSLFKRSKEFLEKNIHTVKSYDEFKKKLEKGGFLRANWCGRVECEDRIKEETTATIRIVPLKDEKVWGKCVACNREAKKVVYFAKAY